MSYIATEINFESYFEEILAEARGCARLAKGFTNS